MRRSSFTVAWARFVCACGRLHCLAVRCCAVYRAKTGVHRVCVLSGCSLIHTHSISIDLSISPLFSRLFESLTPLVIDSLHSLFILLLVDSLNSSFILLFTDSLHSSFILLLTDSLHPSLLLDFLSLVSATMWGAGWNGPRREPNKSRNWRARNFSKEYMIVLTFYLVTEEIPGGVGGTMPRERHEPSGSRLYCP